MLAAFSAWFVRDPEPARGFTRSASLVSSVSTLGKLLLADRSVSFGGSKVELASREEARVFYEKLANRSSKRLT